MSFTMLEARPEADSISWRRPYDECTCDEGMHWNNADPTSNMGDRCEECDYEAN